MTGTALQTLLLDTATWDLCLDIRGDIATASPPYAVAQDVASAIRTFAGEVWYDTTLGLPYFARVLGRRVSIPVLKAMFEGAALAVPGVVTATAYLTSFADRQLSGQVQVTDTAGTTSAASFSTAGGFGTAALGSFVLGSNRLA